ncbi:MAG: hypothetical protein N2517_03370 [Ignavibacteria bacterium]|nr:hypothetical protein [Ignavibacteria bacterium]
MKILFAFLISVLITNAQINNTLFESYKNFLAKPSALNSLKNYQIIGVIINENNDSLEFVLHRLLPDTLRLQVRFDNIYAITVVKGTIGWIVDPTRNIYQPTDLHPEEVVRTKSNILSLFSFFDNNIFEQLKILDNQKEDVEYHSFSIVNLTNDTTTYFLSKKNELDIYKLVSFYQSPFTFKIIPRNFFQYKGFAVPRTLEIIANNSKKTIVQIVSININSEIDKNLFFYNK